MRNVHLQTNFSAGEISPRMYGRSDVSRYAFGAKEITNGVCTIQGGVIRRRGLKMINTLPAQITGTVILVPFIYNREQSYILEFSEHKIRLYQSGAIVVKSDKSPVEITTDITAAQLVDGISYSQGSDTMFIARRDGRPLVLQRMGHTDWTIKPVPFEILPFEEIRKSPDGWLKPSAIGPLGGSITLTLANDEKNTGYTGTGFTAADIGSWVRINGGLVKITALTDNRTVTGEVRSVLLVDAIASDDLWRLMQPSWSDELGWPQCVLLHQQRLLFANSKKFPQTIWGSRLMEMYNFELGYLDTSAFSFQIFSEQANPIISLSGTNALIALTANGEFTLSDIGSALAIPLVKNPSSHGASKVRPVKVGSELMYIQQSHRKLLSISYDPDSAEPYSVSDKTMLAEHITAGGVRDMCYQRQPDGTLWVVLHSGAMVCATISKEAEVIAWSKVSTLGTFEAVATIPTMNHGDDVYVVTNRGGHRFLELFTEGLHVDCALHGMTSTHGGATEWHDLGHLEGLEVDIVADGIPQPRAVVRNGTVTLHRKAHSVDIGLPFATRIHTLPPEIPSQMGASQGGAINCNEVALRLIDTVGCSVNGDIVSFRDFGTAVLDDPLKPFTGEVSHKLLGTGNSEVVISQEQPLPFHLLSLVRKLTINH